MNKNLLKAPLGALLLSTFAFGDDCNIQKKKFDLAFAELDRTCKSNSDCVASDRLWDQCQPKIYISTKNTLKTLTAIDQLRAEGHRVCKFVMAPCPSIPALTPVCELGICSGQAMKGKIQSH